MKTGLALFLFFSLVTVGRADDTLPAWNADTQTAWWAQNPTPDSWEAAAKDLEARLDAAYKKDGSSCFSQPDFQGWMEHLEWIKTGLACRDLVTDGNELKTFVSLGKDETVSHLFVEKLDPLDDKKEALKILLHLAETKPDDLHEYPALGIAYSLVFDQPFPDDWPHHQVAQSAVPIGDLDVVDRFNFYVQANRDKKTELDLTQVPFEDLKFLVDSKVKLSELTYAQASHVSYKDFFNAFFSITYDESRVQSAGNMVLNWDLPTYTLHDIEKHGGICVDQAYYASILGKGRGIPTIFFTGQGSGGGHAWFGYLMRQLKWELDCGRYANQNYPKGYALDPQTWQQIKDTAVDYQVKNGPTNPHYPAATTALAWARLHSGDPSARQILDDARSIMPELIDIWEEESTLMDAGTEIDPADKKAFYQAWITQFQSSADLKVDGQTHLLAVLKQANDPEAENLQRSIILQNRSAGFDLGIKGSVSAVTEKMDAGDWDGARLEFQKAVRDFKDQGGGTFFNEVIAPYVVSCAAHGQFKQAEEGIKFTEDRMSIDSKSILGVEFDHLKRDLDVMQEAFPPLDQWVGKIDAGEYEEVWNNAAKAYQDQVSLKNWLEFMDRTRKPLGKFTSRTITGTPRVMDHAKLGTAKVPVELKGEFFYVRYRTTFDAKAFTEDVLLQKTGDGKWIVSGYWFRPFED